MKPEEATARDQDAGARDPKENSGRDLQMDSSVHSKLRNGSATVKTFDPNQTGTSVRGQTARRWRWFAGVSAVLLTILTVAGIYLVARRPSTIDQLVILTVPSGADIQLNGKDYGHSPVKLERLAVGTYSIAITKENYESVERAIEVNDSSSLEFKLKPVMPSETVDLPTEEQIRSYQLSAEAAFARGHIGLVDEGSAYYYAYRINYLDSTNQFAKEMMERIRVAAHQGAQSAVARGDLAQAKDYYSFLVDKFPYDEEARAGAARIENQLAGRRGKIGELVRKAEEALQSGHLTEPKTGSAYYYAKQVLAIDKENQRAREIRNDIKDRLTTAGEQANTSGNVDAAIRQLDEAAQLFPEDKHLRTRVHEMETARTAELEKDADPNTHRVKGLELYAKQNYEDAIQELEIGMAGGRSGNEVIFALARSYQRLGHLDQAESYFQKMPPTAGDPYRSAIAALGDIAAQRGETQAAVDKWKQARQLGGSTIYPLSILDDKIERVERKQREKAAEPQPLTVTVRHLHGGLLGGSCSGSLSVSSTGVNYDGKDHQYSYNVAGVGVRIVKDEMTIQFGRDSQKFKVSANDAERFRETLNRYQNR